MTATRLRLILSGVVALLAGVTIVGIWLSQQFLVDQVKQTDHAKIDADISEQEVAKFRKLQNDLVNQADIIGRAKQIAANSAQYNYQDQVINDLTVYASRNGVGINSFDFAQTSAKPGIPPSGKTALSIALKSPLAYSNFLTFVRQIEQNLTKLQITSITLAPNPQKPTEILNPTISLEVFLKK